MPIKSSTIVEDSPQIDGRRYIREVHTDDVGVEHHVTYLAESKEDVEAILPIRVSQIDEQIAEKQVIEQALIVAEKERAVELLKLGDESIAKILMVSGDAVAEEKVKLEDVATKVIDVKSAEKVVK
jgi:hypothetical protein